MTAPNYCAIDFGTSNSAVAIADGTAMRLIELEPGFRTMPTAVFYPGEAEGRGGAVLPRCEFGRAAIAAYVDGIDGRLMRSMKSILGSSLVEQTTDVGGGRGVLFIDIVATYLRHLRHLRQCAEAAAGAPIDRAVLGRPVYFVDDDAERDAHAEAALRRAATRAGFRELVFQYEPIAAAFDHEQSAVREERVLVADIGGGTSDFSLVRVGPERKAKVDRKGDILANHGVHIAPAPTSIGASSWHASCRCWATAPTGRASTARRRAKCRARSTSISRPGTSSTPSTTRSASSSCAACALFTATRRSTAA